MTGPDHYRKAEYHVERARDVETNGALSELVTGWAHVHAIQGLTAAVALLAANISALVSISQGGKPSTLDPESQEWIDTVSPYRRPQPERR